MKEVAIDELIKKYENGLCTAEEEAFLSDLTNHNLWPNKSIDTFDNEEDKSKTRERVLQGLRKKISPVKFWLFTVKRTIQANPVSWVAAALVLMTLGILPLLKENSFGTNYIVFAKNENALSEKKVKLPDGSLVTLKGESSLLIHQKFNEEMRKIKFEGKGFFDIARNEQKPFIVDSYGLITSVLGTSFEIDAMKGNREIEVEVFTGKVSVSLEQTSDKAKKAELVLTPNLKAVFDKKTKIIHETIVDNPSEIKRSIQSGENVFKYEGQKVEEILKDIQRVYGVEIILLNEACGNHLFTGDLINLTLYQKLNLTCNVTGLDFETKGAKIIVKGKDCN